MKLMIPVISLCLASAAPCALSQATAQPNLSTIDQYVETALQKSHGAGISVAVVQDGKVILAKGYGLANVELSVPATENTVYQIASVTKTFTATAINMLVDEDKLKLDDKIVSHLPDLPAAWKEVTIRQLLSHTSGIKSYTSVKDFFKTAQRTTTGAKSSTWWRKHRWNSRPAKSGTTAILATSCSGCSSRR